MHSFSASIGNQDCHWTCSKFWVAEKIETCCVLRGQVAISRSLSSQKSSVVCQPFLTDEAIKCSCDNFVKNSGVFWRTSGGEFCGKSQNITSTTKCIRFEATKWFCQTRMKEILSYLRIFRTTSMFFMYETIIVNKILVEVLWSKNAKKYKWKKVFSSSPILPIRRQLNVL